MGPLPAEFEKDPAAMDAHVKAPQVTASRGEQQNADPCGGAATGGVNSSGAENLQSEKSGDSGKFNNSFSSDASSHDYKQLDWMYIQDSYAFVGKIWLGTLVALGVFACPFWVASRFVRTEYQYDERKFYDECQKDPDTPYQEKNIVFWMLVRYIPYALCMSLIALVIRVEKFCDVDDAPENQNTMKRIRYTYAPIAVLFMVCSVAVRMFDVNPRTNRLNWLVSVLCSVLACVFIIMSILRQGQYTHKKWFKTRFQFFCCFLVCFLVMAINVGVMGYSGDILASYGSRAQVAMLLLANGLQIVLKHAFAQSGMDAYLCVAWIVFITCCFHVPIRLYTFVLPDISDIILANGVNFVAGVGGQVFNFCFFTFRLKVRKVEIEEKYIKIINLQHIHELFVSHECNLVAFLVVLCSDPRYYGYSAKVGPGYVLNPALFAVSVTIAVLTELIKNMVMLKLTTLSVPFCNMPKYCKSKAMTETFIPFAIMALFVSAVYCNDLRKDCLMCGTEDPGLVCLETIQ